ncbi:MAG: membrane protease YdiL (CAAX protease family) [Candidatus Omnitrophota bacterium]|jgi:membrane protease YdiL (CAAX protease family)
MLCSIAVFVIQGNATHNHDANSMEVKDDFSISERLKTTEAIRDIGMESILGDQPNKGILVFGLLMGMALVGGLILNIFFLFGWRPYFVRIQSPHWGQVPWGIVDLIKIFVLIIFSELIISVIIGVLSGIFKLSPSTGFVVMSSTLLRSVFVLSYCLIYLRRKYGASASDLGWNVSDPKRLISTGVVAYLAMIPIYVLALIALTQVMQLFNYTAPVQAPVQMLLKEDSQHVLLGMTLLVGIAGPFFEEILFRGILYRVVRNYLGATRGILITSLLFAAIHAHMAAFVPILLLGLTLNYLYEKTHSILPGAIMHAMHNTLMVGAAFGLRGVLS